MQPTDVSVGGTTLSTFTMVQPSGGCLVAQVWDAGSWTDRQVAELGAGPHVAGIPATTVG